MTRRPVWYCDALPYRRKPCDDVPCKGHRVTKDVRLAAEVLSWGDGYELGIFTGAQADDPMFAKLRQDYLNEAARFLAHRVTP